MSITIEIPTELQPIIQAAVEKGQYADEQEFVTEVLRLAVPALQGYQKLKNDVQTSLEQIDRGDVREADFDSVREKL